MVNFESNNAEKPYVSGAMYNGKEVSGYATADNRYKVLHSRIGNRLIMDDETGDVTLESQKGQTIAVFYGDGNIDITAPKNINISAVENVSITAGMNITSNAGMNISETAGTSHSSFAGGMMIQNAVADYSLMAANIMEVAQGERKSRAKEVTDQSKEKKIISENKNEVHTKGTFDNNSGENSKMH
ncbi:MULTISPECIES: hypothetical protein [unclassified Chryseobacterium]|uniref:hypothetical protein n=1 Tax=unclassified Chryseobacterium TaxID=2593645 RepID=UPI002269F501|nr:MULTISPECIES: hypothetical protein [unclassified Chryseobacterium]